MPVTDAVLARGRERFDIFCSPCHDRVGTGQGMIVQRGYKQPPSFHIDRLRGEADGYFFDVITNGFGVMPSYAQQVPVADRWAITRVHPGAAAEPARGAGRRPRGPNGPRSARRTEQPLT